MISVMSAWSIVKRHNTGMKVSICHEVDNYYMFSLVPEDLAIGDGYGCFDVYVIDKKQENIVLHILWM